MPIKGRRGRRTRLNLREGGWLDKNLTGGNHFGGEVGGGNRFLERSGRKKSSGASKSGYRLLGG